MKYCSSKQSSAGCALHRALVDVPASLLGIPARRQPERDSEGLQGHVGEHRRADGVRQAGNEDHHRADGGASQPGEVHQLFDPGAGVHQDWRRRRLVGPLLRDRGGPAGDAGRRQGGRQLGHVHHRLLAAAPEEQRQHHLLQRAHPRPGTGGQVAPASSAAVPDQLSGRGPAQEEPIRVHDRGGHLGRRGPANPVHHGFTIERR